MSIIGWPLLCISWQSRLCSCLQIFFRWRNRRILLMPQPRSLKPKALRQSRAIAIKFRINGLVENLFWRDRRWRPRGNWTLVDWLNLSLCVSANMTRLLCPDRDGIWRCQFSEMHINPASFELSKSHRICFRRFYWNCQVFVVYFDTFTCDVSEFWSEPFVGSQKPGSDISVTMLGSWYHHTTRGRLFDYVVALVFGTIN